MALAENDINSYCAIGAKSKRHAAGFQHLLWTVRDKL